MSEQPPRNKKNLTSLREKAWICPNSVPVWKTPLDLCVTEYRLCPKLAKMSTRWSLNLHLIIFVSLVYFPTHPTVHFQGFKSSFSRLPFIHSPVTRLRFQAFVRLMSGFSTCYCVSAWEQSTIALQLQSNKKKYILLGQLNVLCVWWASQGSTA